MDDKLYFDVKGINIKDLYDWSTHSKTQNEGTVKRPGLLTRQNSQTGSLVKVNDMQIALFRYRDEVFAVNEKCPHAGGPLHLGDIEDLPGHPLCVRCPWHSWRWDLQTGVLCKPRGRADHLCAMVFPTKIHPDGTISIGFDEFGPEYFSNFEF